MLIYEWKWNLHKYCFTFEILQQEFYHEFSYPINFNTFKFLIYTFLFQLYFQLFYQFNKSYFYLEDSHNSLM